MIQLENLSISYQKELLRNFSFSFPEKGIICLFGPSGCGKTTLLKLMLGLEIPDTGRLHGIEGKTTSVVFQEDRLLPWLSGKENILAVTDNMELCEELIKEFDMEADIHKLPDEMSGGMKRRVTILRALAYNGDIFFLDEPFQALDFMKRKEIMDLLRKRLANKLTFFITHHIEEVFALADVLLVFHGEPLEIVEQIPRTDFLSETEIAKKIASYYK